MALVRCRSCDEIRAVGFMPTASCGLLLLPALGAAVFATLELWPVLSGWALPAGLAVFVAAASLTKHLPHAVEWLWAQRSRCTGCGARRWSWPFTSGSGL